MTGPNEASEESRGCVYDGQAIAATARSRETAFTLVELLTVVAIVGTILAITAPCLSHATSKVRSVHCKSNLRQLMIATRSYVDDSGEFPLFIRTVPEQQIFWPDVIAGQISENVKNQVVLSPDSTVFTCPAFRRRVPRGDLEPVTYGYNALGFAFRGLGGKLVQTFGGLKETAVEENEVQYPSETIAIADGLERISDGSLIGTGIHLQRWVLSPPVGMTARDVQATDRWVRQRHRGRANVGFCDGHVESNSLRLLFEDTSDEALRRWNRDHEPHRDWLVQ